MVVVGLSRFGHLELFGNRSEFRSPICVELGALFVPELEGATERYAEASQSAHVLKQCFEAAVTKA